MRTGLFVVTSVISVVFANQFIRDSQIFMPKEYKEIKSLVNELADHNELGDRQIKFTIVSGPFLGWYAEKLKLCDEDSCNFYEDLNPYINFKGYKSYEVNEATRQSYVFDSVYASANSNGVIRISRSTFRTLKFNREYLGCVIAHELNHFIDMHIFEDDRYVSMKKKGLDESALMELQAERSRSSEVKAQNNAVKMMTNAGYPVEICLNELKYTYKIAGLGAITQPENSHPGYDEWVDKTQKFINSETMKKDKGKDLKTNIRWEYDRSQNVLKMIPIN